MIGYNRRFAPGTVAAKKSFAGPETPLCVNYRVNADQISPDHWIHDRSAGGGRVISEVCHFVDFVQYVTNSVPERVWATRTQNQSDENVQVSVDFADGSVVSILYTTLEDMSLLKGRIKLFSGG